MTDSAYAASDEDFDDYVDDEIESGVPGRPRRPFLTKWSAAALALLVGAVGFYVGIRVEKNDAGSGTAASAFASRLASGVAARSAATGSGSTSKSTGAGSSGGFPSGGFPGGAGGGGTSGTVSSIDGNTLYVKESDGNTVKVKLTGATTITKSETVSKAKVFPGDTVTATAVKGSGGALTATALTDSGASASGSSNGRSGSSSTGSASVSSLFGS